MRFICGLGWATLALSAAQVVSGGLTLEVTEGDGAIYNVRARTAAPPPHVRVVDAAGHPVEGAFVTFRLPESGPGAQFSDGRIATVPTDVQGHAAAPALKLNSQLGPWELRIAAVHRGMVTRASIQQINAAPAEAIAGGGAGKRSRGLYWLAAVSAGAAVAASVGFRNSSSPVRSGGVSALGAAATGSQAVSIGVGAGSIGAP